MRKFSRRFDLVNGKYFSIFLGVFVGIVKVTHLAPVINFCEMAQGSIDQPKVDKNNRESTFFFFFFNTAAKQVFTVPSLTQQQKQKVCSPFF